MLSNLLTTKAKKRLMEYRYFIYCQFRKAAHRLKAFIYDPDDSTPVDSSPDVPKKFITLWVKCNYFK